MKIKDDLFLCLAWLSRIPVPTAPARPLASAVWGFPVVGALIGAGGAVAWAAGGMASPFIGAVAAVAAMILLCGGMHEDGLADYADGTGGKTRDQRLEIMRDSRIGSYGVLALLCVTLFRIGGVMALDHAADLVLAAMTGRVAMAGALLMPPARQDGLGRGAGRPTMRGLILAVVIWGGMVVVGLLVGHLTLSATLWGAGLGIGLTAMILHHAKRSLGGVTGDVLGAVCLISETAMLIGLATG